MSSCSQVPICLPEIPILELYSCANTVVRVTGSAGINPVNLTGMGGVSVYTSGGYVVIFGDSVAATGDYITTAQTGQFASAVALAQTGSTLFSLINASTAGVGSLNLLSGALNVLGVGNITVTTGSQSIIVSGDTGVYVNFATLIQLAASGQKITSLSGYVNNVSGSLQALINSTSGALNNSISNTGYQAWNAANNNSINLSGNLGQSGSNLYVLLTGLSGQSITDYSTKTNLTQTGSILDGRISSLSGFTISASGALQAQIVGGAGTQVRVSGSSSLSIADLTGIGGLVVFISGGQVFFSGSAGAGGVTQAQFDALSGNLIQSGAILYALVTGFSGQTAIDYATKIQLTNSGIAIEAQINSLSGFTTGASGFLQAQINVLPTTTQLALTGSQAWNAANNNGINLSGNLNTTGSNLYILVTGLSGQVSVNDAPAAANYVYRSGNQPITGIKNFVSNTVLQIASGANFIISGNPVITGLIARDNMQIVNNNDGTLTVAATGYGMGTNTLAYFSPLDNNPPATSFAVFNTRNSIPTLDFDPTTNYSAVFNGVMPRGAMLDSGVRTSITWVAGATAGTVIWAAQLMLLGGSNNIDTDTYGPTGVTSTVTSSTVGNFNYTEITITGMNGIVTGSAYRLKILRNAAATGDNMTGNAQYVMSELRSVM